MARIACSIVALLIVVPGFRAAAVARSAARQRRAEIAVGVDSPASVIVPADVYRAQGLAATAGIGHGGCGFNPCAGLRWRPAVVRLNRDRRAGLRIGIGAEVFLIDDNAAEPYVLPPLTDGLGLRWGLSASDGYSTAGSDERNFLDRELDSGGIGMFALTVGLTFR